MTLTGPQKIPFANTTRAWYENTYKGSDMESNVGVIHTTEGTTLPSYGGGASAPNVTGVPDIKNKKINWFQHYSVDRSSRALVNESGGVQTNTANAFQVELVGTCDPRRATEWNGLKAGVDYIFWPSAPDWALAEVGKLVRWLSDNHKIQAKSTVEFRAYPGSYGKFAKQRLTGAEWQAYYGWLGHQHVPENDHGDPGNIDIDRIIQFALSGAAPEKEAPVALSKDDVNSIFNTDGLITSPLYDKDPSGNKFWTAGQYFRNTYHRSEGTEKKVVELTKKVVALTAKVDALIAKLG